MLLFADPEDIGSLVFPAANRSLPPHRSPSLNPMYLSKRLWHVCERSNP